MKQSRRKNKGLTPNNVQIKIELENIQAWGIYTT